MPEGVPTTQQEGHLNKDVNHIFVCVGTSTDFDATGKDVNFGVKLDFPHNIDFNAPSYDLRRKNFLNSGWGTYVLSVVDNRDKFSEGLYDCTSLVVAGIDKETKENISFLSHQNPKEFLKSEKEDFVRHLKQQLAELKNKCIPGTIDAVVVGGNYLTQGSMKGNPYKQNYLDSIQLLTSEVKQVIGFEPMVVNGPKISSGQDRIHYDNKNRRLYFIRPKVNSDTKDFIFSDVDKEKHKWE
jgi:hypothetical protein